MPNTETAKALAKIAVVTGGSRGLGRNTVINLARRGVDVIFTYNSRQDEAKQVVAELEAEGRKATAIQLDVSDAFTFAGFSDKVREALQGFGAERFDYLVNNAGTSRMLAGRAA